MSTPTLKCAVITPVGPGHETLIRQSQASVEIAKRNPGLFTEILFFPMDDLQGTHGRSKRRNDGIEYALAHGFDWIFFLDADDVMTTDAFASVAHYIHDYDAIFGLIAEAPVGSDQVTLRPKQLGVTDSLSDIIKNDPFLTLQMGHFVRTKAAATIRFDTEMNTGEDFKYYLELWKQCRCKKIDRVFFINRRGTHSTGPKSATGKEWRTAVSHVFEDFCIRNNINHSFIYEGKQVCFAIGNPMDLIHRHFIASTFFEATELRYLRTIIPPNSTIVDIGANVGNHLIYFGLFMHQQKIIPIEPNPSAITLLKKNIELNHIANVDTSLLGFGIGETYGNFNLQVADYTNIGAARLIAQSQGDIEVYPLDAKLKEKVDFIKIDVEWMEMEALRGMSQIIQDSQPALFIEIMNENTDDFLRWTETQHYKIIKTFPYVNAKNFVAAPEGHPLAQAIRSRP